MTDWNIAKTLTEITQRFPERTGLIEQSFSGDRYWTFGDLDSTASAYAHGLTGAGVKHGDRVMLMVRPSKDFVCLTFALFKIGAVVILIDPGMGYKNLRRCIGAVKPAVFIGIPKAHFFKLLFPEPFKTVRTNICVGFGLRNTSSLWQRITASSEANFPTVKTKKNDLAAIIFTTGSTGPPKGVQYTHGIFRSQLDLIRNYYGITPEDVDQPAFPLFALFSAALGACAVIPDMNPARPVQVDPKKFIKSILKHNVTYSFGSPAIWNVVSRYCLQNKIMLPSLKKVLMAGAPVSGELTERVKAIMPPDGEVHTPYGSTECLPVSSMTGTEILTDTWKLTRKGHGTCVGRPLPGIEIKIITASESPQPTWDATAELPINEIGEIVAKGDVVTRAYDHNEKENRLAKISDGQTFWHRIGDVGYLDEQGRVWFCGRKAHRVITKQGILYTICCEALFNEHPDVFRSALAGVGPAGEQTPVIVVEPHEKPKNPEKLLRELRHIAQANPLTHSINNFMIHPAFPVDIRHNAKIFREKLAAWAADRLQESLRN